MAGVSARVKRAQRWGAGLAVNDLISFRSELISKSVAFVGGPTMVQELEAMRMNSSVARASL